MSKNMTNEDYFGKATKSSAMNAIINNPGLQHLAEGIFCNLNYEDLKICEEINDSTKRMLANPFFWLQKHIRSGLSKKNQDDWTEAIRLTNNTELERFVLSYLKMSTRNEKLTDLSCYINEHFITKNSERIIENMMKSFPNAPGQLKEPLLERTPIFEAALYGDNEIVQILAPLTDDPNAPDECGFTPIYSAAQEGHTEIVQILAPLTDDPNAPNIDGTTPMNRAALFGHTEIVRILASLADNPNTPDKWGKTPIHRATKRGFTEIVQILAPLADNPNAPPPDNSWETPIFLAACNGHEEIVKILSSF